MVDKSHRRDATVRAEQGDSPDYSAQGVAPLPLMIRYPRICYGIHSEDLPHTGGELDDAPLPASNMQRVISYAGFTQRQNDETVSYKRACADTLPVTTGIPGSRRQRTEVMIGSFYQLLQTGSRTASEWEARAPARLGEISARSDGEDKRDTALSEREIEVLSWVREGKTSWEIGKILGISERTVKFHLRNGRQKLNAANRAQAVAVAVQRGYLRR